MRNVQRGVKSGEKERKETEKATAEGNEEETAEGLEKLFFLSKKRGYSSILGVDE